MPPEQAPERIQPYWAVQSGYEPYYRGWRGLPYTKQLGGTSTITMTLEPDVSSLSNPLATVEQLSTSSSQLDGVPPDLESSLRFAGAQLTQAAGILLRLPQEIIAQAIVIFYRFYVGSEGGSFRINALKVPWYAASLGFWLS